MSDRGKAPLTDFLQQSEDVKDKLEQLIPWLTKLLEGLAKVDPNDDQREIERRTQLARLVLNNRSPRPEESILCRSLEAIAQQSQTILAKGKGTRFLDKAQDAGEAGRLIDQLQQAILIYQVGTKTCEYRAG
jgi:hypothetical protein